MKIFLLVSLCVTAALAANVGVTMNTRPAGPQNHLVCYYDSSNFVKEGFGKLIVDDIEPALQFCNVLIYGYAGIERDTYRAVSLNPNLDLDLGKGLYRTVTKLKRKYPNVKILLSVGGDKDIETGEDAKDLPNKYLQLLESPAGRARFIETANALVTTYGFDGLDMAWQFPKNKPKKVHSGLGSLWKGFKKVFTGDHVVDPDAEQHKEQFTALLRELKIEMRKQNLMLSATVLPNVNSSSFFDVPAIVNYLDFVNLAAFDFYTPERNPEQADVSAPLYELPDHNPEFNVNYQVNYWLNHNCPASKINVGVASYGRVWKLKETPSSDTKTPVEDVENAAPPGPNTQTQSLWSWAEICALLPTANNAYAKGASAPIRKINNPSKQFATALRPVDKKGEHGVWISYDDPDTAAEKAGYVHQKQLGGIAIFDLAYDDFRGSCVNEKYPIVRAVKYRLEH